MFVLLQCKILNLCVSKFATHLHKFNISRKASAREVMSIPFSDDVFNENIIAKNYWAHALGNSAVTLCCFLHNAHYHFKHQYHISPVGRYHQYKATTFSTSQITRISSIPSAFIVLQQTNVKYLVFHRACGKYVEHEKHIQWFNGNTWS